MIQIRESYSTPWGRSDTEYNLSRGITWVTTPSHGGLLIAKGIAEKLLSEPALDEGDRYGGYYAYEEDRDWCIPCYESDQIRRLVYSGVPWADHPSYEHFSKDIEQSVKQNYPKYIAKLAGQYKGLKKSDIEDNDIIYNGMKGDRSNEGYSKVIEPYKNRNDEWLVWTAKVAGGPLKRFRITFSMIEFYLAHGGKLLTPKDQEYHQVDKKYFPQS